MNRRLLLTWIWVALLFSAAAENPSSLIKNKTTDAPNIESCSWASIPLSGWIFLCFIAVVLALSSFTLGYLFGRKKVSSYEQKVESPEVAQKEKRGTKKHRPVLKRKRELPRSNTRRRRDRSQQGSRTTVSRSTAGSSPPRSTTKRRSRTGRIVFNEKGEDIVSFFRWINAVDKMKKRMMPQHRIITPALTSFSDGVILGYLHNGQRIIDILNLIFNTKTMYGNTAEESHTRALKMLKDQNIYEYNMEDILKRESLTGVKITFAEIFIRRRRYDLCGIFYSPILKSCISSKREREKRKEAGKEIFEMLLEMFDTKPPFYYPYQLILKDGKPIKSFKDFLKLVFYCGKGTGLRAQAHAVEAYVEGADRTGYRKNDAIKMMWEAGKEIGLCVYTEVMPEKVALIVESSLISTLSLNELCNIRCGESVDILNEEQQLDLAIFILCKQYKKYREVVPGLSKEEVANIVNKRREKKVQKSDTAEDLEEDEMNE